MLLEGDVQCYTRENLEVFNLLKHPVWVFDIERKGMFWANRAGLEIWNASSLEELLNRDFASDMSDAADVRMKDVLVRLANGAVLTEQWTFYPQKRPTTLSVTASGIRIEGGRIASLSEIELPNKEGFDEDTVRSLEMLRHLPFAVSQFSVEGNLVYQNPEAVNLFGMTTSAEAISDILTDKNNHDDFLRRFVDREIAQNALKQVQEGVEFSGEAQQQTLQGPKWFSVALRRTRDPVNGEFMIVHSARDITDVIAARKDTVQAAMKSEFMAVMAHEIRTPLHQVIGYLDLLELTVLSAEQFESVKQVQSSTSLLMSIINDLLDYSKLESGQVQVENVSFAVEGLLNSCVASVRPEVHRKALALTSKLSGDLPSKLIGDPNRLRQILLNLLSNAVKFTDTGSVSLAASCMNSGIDGVRIRFEVSDTGIGIDPKEHDVVFEKYRQANASVARHFGGTGLGLVICKGLAELMGGTISLVSEVDKGTTMIVEIPFQFPANETERVVRESPATAEDTGGLRLLVVEDNLINQKVMRSMLQRLGHTVTVAENGKVALEELRLAIFDLVLMDIQMPVMDGIECTKQIRRVLGHDKSQLPVVGLTASFQRSELDFYLDVGMNDCLGKPLRLDALKQAISIAVHHPNGVRLSC